MTAAEKAMELADKFRIIEHGEPSNIFYETLSKDAAKQCALITVDEILSGTGLLTYIEYWQDVKTEIEKL